MEVSSGDILGLASFPGYTADTLEEAIQDPDSPMINRALYAYPVGSIFKLVTAACAKDSELADTFQWDCTGTISVEGQLFRCHDDQGHGRQTMPLAMRNSCNPFFIQLSQQLSGAALRQTAKALGFGQEIPLTTGQVASSGTLPTLQQLQLPAERANFGFGQGILTATPLQITRMTCAIAGDGTLPEVRLVRGITEDGRNVLRESSARHSQGISAETAAYLRSLMCYAAADSDFAVIHPVTGLDDLHRLVCGGELLLVQRLKICKRHNMAPPCSFFPSHEGFPIPIVNFTTNTAPWELTKQTRITSGDCAEMNS